jgi:hypothetical protein
MATSGNRTEEADRGTPVIQHDPAVEKKRRSRFVDPGATVTLPLSEGDWIKVKVELMHGEHTQLTTAGLGSEISPGSDKGVGIDWNKYALARKFTWLVDWSFEDAQGRPVPVSWDTIAALRQEDAEEIDAALDAYIGTLEAEKNARLGLGPDGAKLSDGTPSPS